MPAKLAIRRRLDDVQYIDRTHEGAGGRYIPGAIFATPEIDQEHRLIDGGQRGWAQQYRDTTYGKQRRKRGRRHRQSA